MTHDGPLSDEPGRSQGGQGARRWLRAGVLAIAVACAVAALAARPEQTARAAAQLGPLSWGLAPLAAAVTVAGAAASWRALLADLGSPLTVAATARVYLPGQLGKYLPGGVWQVVTQAELARDEGVPGRRAASASLLAMVVAVATAILVGLPALPAASRGGLPVWPVAVVAAVVLVLLHPRVLRSAARRLGARTGAVVPERMPGAGGLARSAGWAIGSWIAAGLTVTAVAVDLGAAATASTALTCLAGYALAWVAGSLVVVAPAGAGARDAVLVLLLAAILPTATAVLAALVVRALLTAVDLIGAGTASVRRRSARGSRWRGTAR